MSNLPGSKVEYDLTRKSSPIVIVPHQARWKGEFEALATRLRRIVPDSVLRIDHIGSTSVPGLGAKDIVDVQMTVSDLDDLQDLQSAIQNHGFVFRSDIDSDNFVGDTIPDPREWRKAYIREPEGERRVHIHVREVGRWNQRYALLFRDFLRANATVCKAYQTAKVRLSKVFPECIDGYLYIKDPLCDIIFEGARLWADQTNWEPDGDHF